MPELKNVEDSELTSIEEFASRRASAPQPIWKQPPGSTVESSGGSINESQIPAVVHPNSPHPQKLKWFREVFRPHFDSWVFGPVDRLVHSQDALVGFIMMACVIDYLAGFWWGGSTKNAVKRAYIGFIDRYFPKDRYIPEHLYDSLRNGLVHLFTIKGKRYALVHNQPNLHLREDTTRHIILNAADFRDDLRAAKDKYFDEVESTPAVLDKLLEQYFREGFLGPGMLEIHLTDVPGDS
jgi:hypothetical protein